MYNLYISLYTERENKDIFLSVVSKICIYEHCQIFPKKYKMNAGWNVSKFKMEKSPRFFSPMYNLIDWLWLIIILKYITYITLDFLCYNLHFFGYVVLVVLFYNIITYKKDQSSSSLCGYNSQPLYFSRIKHYLSHVPHFWRSRSFLTNYICEFLFYLCNRNYCKQQCKLLFFRHEFVFLYSKTFQCWPL